MVRLGHSVSWISRISGCVQSEQSVPRAHREEQNRVRWFIIHASGNGSDLESGPVFFFWMPSTKKNLQATKKNLGAKRRVLFCVFFCGGFGAKRRKAPVKGFCRQRLFFVFFFVGNFGAKRRRFFFVFRQILKKNTDPVLNLKYHGCVKFTQLRVPTRRVTVNLILQQDRMPN